MNFADRFAESLVQQFRPIIVPLLRVPQKPPELPRGCSGDPAAVEVFHPAPGFLQYLKFWFWLVLFIVDIALLIVWIVICIAELWVGLLLFAPFAVLIIAPDIIAYIAIKLRYDTTWYAMTDRAIRIRRGIWIIRETTLSFENVQNVRVQQGPVQRHFGIADLIVETAGSGGAQGKGGSTGGVSNQGVIEGVSDAHRIRDLILKRLRQSKGAGLGDEEFPETRSAPKARTAWSPVQIAILRDIRDAATALRPRGNADLAPKARKFRCGTRTGVR